MPHDTPDDLADIDEAFAHGAPWLPEAPAPACWVTLATLLALQRADPHAVGRFGELTREALAEITPMVAAMEREDRAPTPEELSRINELAGTVEVELAVLEQSVTTLQ